MSQQQESGNGRQQPQPADETENKSASTQRKRHSPQTNNAAGSSGSNSIAIDSAHSSKVRKVSTAASQPNKSKSKDEADGVFAANQQPPASSNESSSSSSTSTARQLQGLIDYFPDRPNVDGNRMTRSRAKALQEQEQNDPGASTTDAGSTAGKNASSKATVAEQLSGQGTSKKHQVQQPQQPQTSSTIATPTIDQQQSQRMEARATSFLSNLVPRMQHLLNPGATGVGSGGATNELNVMAAAGLVDNTLPTYHFAHGHHQHHVSMPALNSIVDGLKSNNEIRQSEAATELADILLLGNEESLPNMPIVEIVQSLCALLQKDQNFELMLTAARCITNMQEALPRALPVIAEAIPLLLQKLKRIEYIDVAEQSLIALEVMSRRNAKNILLAGGIASTISHVDFFSLPSQRLAFSIAANCAIYVSANEFSLVKDCFPDLTQRLVYMDDKRILESICIFFNRVIENMRQHSEKLRQIAGINFEFLNNVQKLLAIQPSNISSNTYLALLKSLRYICSQSSEAALALVRMEFGNTIRFLLLGNEKPERETSVDQAPIRSSSCAKINVDLSLRPPQQLREIITLIGQIVQKLPTDSDEVLSLLHLFPLFVEIGTNSTCTQLRHESLNVMMKMCCAVDKAEQLEPIICGIPLAVYIAAILSSNRNLGILSSALQLAKVLLEKLPKLYIPQFETEGVFHEIKRLTAPIQSPIIDRKPEARSAMAEHILEGLVGSSGSQAAGTSNVRVLIPQMLFGQSSSGSNSNSQSHQESLKQQQDVVCAEAKRIVDKFVGDEATKKFGIKELMGLQKNYDKLCGLSVKFCQTNIDAGMEPLEMLKSVLLDSKNRGVPTSFQFNQSGIVSSLIKYLTDSSEQIRPSRAVRLRRFAAVFFNLKDNHLHVDSVDAADRFVPFELLVTKVLSTIATIEQFQVRITNLSGIITSGSSSSLPSYPSPLLGTGGTTTLISTTLRGAQALRFFQTHQIRGNLRRHPSSKNIREWRHGRGTIKVDPFTSVSAIERYLIERGVGIANEAQAHVHSDGDEDSDDISDEDLSLSSTLSNEGHIELYIGENHLPSDISILQAIRQFSLPQDEDSIEVIPSSIWLTTHTIYYKTPPNEPPNSSKSTESIASSTASNTSISIKKTSNKSVQQQAKQDNNALSSSSANTAVPSQPASSQPTPSATSLRSRSKTYTKMMGKKGGSTRSGGETSASASSSSSSESVTYVAKENDVYKTGTAPKCPSPLDSYLSSQLNNDLVDPSRNCLTLLQVLYGLNTYWWKIFDEEEELIGQLPTTHKPIISQSHFYSSKLNAKVNRQLCDFLTVATQQIPKWTLDLVKAVPFVFNFCTRRSFLFCTAFGRDRALMHLVNETGNEEPDGAGHEAASRLIPRLERRKFQIKRDSLLKEAQRIFSQLNTSKAMLEVGFQEEVGTGFGPTLEFYSTLSRALQKHSLQLWDGKVQQCAESDGDGTGDNLYVFAAQGLYPQMSGSRTLSPKRFDQHIKRFELVGRLLAQALIDSRMLDLDLAPPIFKWLIGEEETLGAEDFERLEPTIYQSLRNIVQTDADQFDALDLFFTYPGDSSLELIKGGKNVQVTKKNCKQFMELVIYWRLVEGVRAEMEALRRGFQLIISKESLRVFTCCEISDLFCGNSDADDKTWSKSVLQHVIRPDHGYSYDSQQIKWLIDMLHTFSKEKRRRFLQFCTGSPRLPVGGFKGLSPPLTVVKKTASFNSNENELPSAMTCYNYLKIPPYESYTTFLDRFEVALQHVYSFFLT